MTHRNEHTGNPSLDRIQGSARDEAKALTMRLDAMEYAHGTAKIARIRLLNKDHIVTPEQFACAFWLIEGTLTAQRTIFVPRALRSAAWSRQVLNNTLGGFAVHLENPEGSASFSTITGLGGHVVTDSLAGPQRWDA